MSFSSVACIELSSPTKAGRKNASSSVLAWFLNILQLRYVDVLSNRVLSSSSSRQPSGMVIVRGGSLGFPDQQFVQSYPTPCTGMVSLTFEICGNGSSIFKNYNFLSDILMWISKPKNCIKNISVVYVIAFPCVRKVFHQFSLTQRYHSLSTLSLLSVAFVQHRTPACPFVWE